MEEYYNHPSRRKLRKRPLILAAITMCVVGLAVLATCSQDDSSSAKIEASEPILNKVGERIQKVLGRSVTIHSDGVVGFPREVMEIVLENHNIQVSTRYESVGWFGVGKSHVVMGGTYRARVGFDLSKASAEVEEGLLRLWLPQPEVLCLETVHVGRQAEDVSWWNPMEPAEMEAAYRANRGEADSRLDQPEMLRGAANRLIERLRAGLGDSGMEVRVEFLSNIPFT